MRLAPQHKKTDSLSFHFPCQALLAPYHRKDYQDPHTRLQIPSCPGTSLPLRPAYSPLCYLLPHSADYGLLHVPHPLRSTIGDCAFIDYIPKLWNSLPQSLCLTPPSLFPDNT
uniref:Uncharacterized protein n=1 Tax=Callorhinchus milii TaxID=7868 RepID=A0A4W3HY30_CALMI